MEEKRKEINRILTEFENLLLSLSKDIRLLNLNLSLRLISLEYQIRFLTSGKLPNKQGGLI